MKILISLCFTMLFLGVAHCQNFNLVPPNKAALKKAVENDKEGNDIVYHYLILNYKPTSDKENVQTFDYDDSMICAFNQSFDNKILFSTSSCSESGGAQVTLQLPKINKTEVKKWIELMYDASLTNMPNQWNKDTYGPTDQEAGCYYTLIDKDDFWKIEIYCGC